jgi:glutamine amidotransferase
MIAIVDYGMGNLHSVSKALERLGYDYEVTDRADRMEAAKGVLLPGVGAFGDAMKELRRLRLDETLLRVTEEGKPLLGICLGMQLLFELRPGCLRFSSVRSYSSLDIGRSSHRIL